MIIFPSRFLQEVNASGYVTEGLGKKFHYLSIDP
jgi:hypothetical protein